MHWEENGSYAASDFFQELKPNSHLTSITQEPRVCFMRSAS